MNATAEIKRSVDLAVDVLLQDNPFDEKQVSALRTMGFNNTENVKDFEDHEKNSHYARHYAQRYPGIKFITAHQLEKVTEKFKLREGELSTFKGAIPEKNINDLLKFEIFESDLDTTNRRSQIVDLTDTWMQLYMGRTLGISDQLMGGRGTGRSSGATFSGGSVDEVRSLSARLREMRDGREPKWNRDNIVSYGAPLWNAVFERDAAEREQKRYQETARINFMTIAQRYPQCLRIIAEPALFVAPDPDLDPIIPVAVKGGYFVATAWGAEASDPDITNAKMN